MLTGNDLLNKLKEFESASLLERMRACGYIKPSASDKAEELDIDGFYDAIIAAKGIRLSDYKDEVSSSPDLGDNELNFVFSVTWEDLDLSNIDDFECVMSSDSNRSFDKFVESIEQSNQSLIEKLSQIHLKAIFRGECSPEFSYCRTISRSHGPSLIYNYDNHKLPFFSTLKANFLMKIRASTLQAWISGYETHRFIEEGAMMRYYDKLSSKGQELEEVFFNIFLNENTDLVGMWPDEASFFLFDSEYISEYYLSHAGTISLKSIIDSLNNKLYVNDFQLKSSTLTWTETEEMKVKCVTDVIHDSFIVTSGQSIDSASLLRFVGFADPLTRRSIALHPDSSKAVLDMLANDESDMVRSALRERQLPSEWHYLHPDDMGDLLLGHDIPANVLDVFSECGTGYDNWRIRSNVASNQNASSLSLSRLGEDLCELVRSSVAKNKSTPLQTLKTLCADPVSDVRNNALQTLNSLQL